MQVVVVDVEGAVRAYVNSLTSLVGPGNPLPNGVHFGARSPSAGAWAEMTGVSARQLDDVADWPRVALAVKAVGSSVDGGARQASARAAVALARALGEFHGPPVVVTTKAGDLVRVIAVGDVQGPVYSANQGGEETYTVDFVFGCQVGP
jgi:hypothetical protein